MWSRRAKAVLAWVMLTLVAAGSTIVPTASAWTDGAVARADATAGQWLATSPPHPFRPGEETTEIEDVNWSFTALSSAGFCADVSVSTTSAAPVSWTLSVDLDAAPYWGASAASLWVEGGIASIRSTANVGNIDGASVIVAGRPILVRICTGMGRRPPVADASWFHVTSAMTGTWTRSQACVETTVTGDVNEATYPYFYGWIGSVDMTAAIQSIRALGGTPTYISWTPDSGGGYQYDLTARSTTSYTDTTVADVFEISSGVGAALRGHDAYAVTACVNAY